MDKRKRFMNIVQKGTALELEQALRTYDLGNKLLISSLYQLSDSRNEQDIKKAKLLTNVINSLTNLSDIEKKRFESILPKGRPLCGILPKGLSIEKQLQIWNEICKTYNTSLIDNLSPEVKRILGNMVSRSNESKGFKGLMRIINNHLYPTIFPKLSLLNGLRSITVHSSEKYKKYIYVMGEYHYSDVKCDMKEAPSGSTFIEHFLLYNIRSSDKFIDLFVENPYKTRSHMGNQIGSLGQIERYFMNYNCADFDKKTCDIPNLRYHYVDIRQPTDNELLNTIFMISFEQRIIPISRYMAFFDNYRQHFENYDTIRKFLENTFKGLKLERQLERMEDKYVKQLLIKYINEKIDIYVEYFNETYPYPKNIVNSIYTTLKNSKKSDDLTKNNEFMANINKFSEIMGAGLMILYVDMYLLARLFRKFKNIKNFNSNEPQYIITYTGEYHANNYREFLSWLNFKEEGEFYSKSVNHNCLDINKLQQPLFPRFM